MAKGWARCVYCGAEIIFGNAVHTQKHRDAGDRIPPHLDKLEAAYVGDEEAYAILERLDAQQDRREA